MSKTYDVAHTVMTLTTCFLAHTQQALGGINFLKKDNATRTSVSMKWNHAIFLWKMGGIQQKSYSSNWSTSIRSYIFLDLTVSRSNRKMVITFTNYISEFYILSFIWPLKNVIQPCRIWYSTPYHIQNECNIAPCITFFCDIKM